MKICEWISSLLQFNAYSWLRICANVIYLSFCIVSSVRSFSTNWYYSILGTLESWSYLWVKIIFAFSCDRPKFSVCQYSVRCHTLKLDCNFVLFFSFLPVRWTRTLGHYLNWQWSPSTHRRAVGPSLMGQRTNSPNMSWTCSNQGRICWKIISHWRLMRWID